MEQKYSLLRQVSRTFALSIEQLPGILQDVLTVAYLLLRVADCIEDHKQLLVEKKVELLHIWSDVLKGSQKINKLADAIADLNGNEPDIYAAQQARFILVELHKLPMLIQQMIVDRVSHTALGMARWQQHGPYVEDEKAMDDYMHEVAGRVGYLLTDIFAWYSPAIRERKAQLTPLSQQFGLALQTVNIIRGMRKDYERGWVFVPQTFYKQVGLTRDSLFDAENAMTALQVVKQLIDKAESHLCHARAFINIIPQYQHQIRLFCMWPLFFAVKTLAISRFNQQVLLSEAKMSRSQVKKIIRHTTLFGWSNHWVNWYYQHLLRT